MGIQGIKTIHVSVIIPVFNSRKYLRQCIESVLNQTLKELEIIIINDGSRDNSAKIICEYAGNDSRIFFINNTIPSGFPGIPRNTGIKRAKGEYIAFVDSDDWIEPQMYETMYERGKKDNLDIVACKYMIQKRITKRVLYSNRIDGARIYNVRNDPEILSLFPALWNKIYKRELLEGIEIRKFKRGEDLSFFWQVMTKAERIGRVDKPFYSYRSLRKGSLLMRTDKSSYDIFRHFNTVNILLIEKDMEKVRPEFDLHRITTVLYEINRINFFHKRDFFRRVVREIGAIDNSILVKLNKFHKRLFVCIKKNLYVLFLVYHYINKIYEQLRYLKGVLIF